jgi:methionyl-tRNA formyltransferase
MKPSIVFFGTQTFAAYILEHLITSNQVDVKLVVTQPDRPQGRDQEVQFSPVKNIATKYQLPILQPESLKNQPTLPLVDLFIVCQYGLIIPQIILDIPKKGTLNVHGSLLPHLRGASPIQTALIEGHKETGITIMLMDEKMDHGPILTQRKLIIADNDTSTTLSEKLMPLAAELLLTSIPLWMNNEITPTPQNDSEAMDSPIFLID